MIKAGETVGGVALQQLRQGRFGVGSLSGRELRLRERPEIVAIATVDRNRVLEAFDRLRVFPRCIKSRPCANRCAASTRVSFRSSPGEKHIGRKEHRDRQEDQRERSQERSSGEGLRPSVAWLHRAAPFRHAVGVQDVVQGDNPDQLPHVRAADHRKNIQSGVSHPFERHAQAVVGINVRRVAGSGLPSPGTVRGESPRPSDSTLRRPRPVRVRCSGSFPIALPRRRRARHRTRCPWSDREPSQSQVRR
jgi:hypothetical protein